MQPLAGALALLLFLFFVNSCIGDTRHNTVAVLKDFDTEVHYSEKDGTKAKIVPHAFNAPAFVSGFFNNKEFLAIISSGRFQDPSQKYYFEAVTKTSYGSGTQWSEAYMFTNVSSTSKTDTLFGDITAVMNGNKIYVLAKTRLKSPSGAIDFTDTLRDPLMVVGTVMNVAVPKSDDVFIKWEEPKSIKHTLSKTVRGTGKPHFLGGQGNSIVTKSGTIMFPIFMVDNNQQANASTLYSADNGLTWHIGGQTESGTDFGSLVEWIDGKLLYTVSSDEGYRKVFESEDKGITWKRSPVFFGVWGNNPQRNNSGSQGSVIAVPVDGGDVLLFSHPLTNKQWEGSDTLQLWLSDGQRIVCVGTISDKEKEETTAYSILAYVGNHLYITHRINPFGIRMQDATDLQGQWQGVTGFTSLPEFFQKTKNTVHAWRKADAELHTKHISTNGLVGFLEKTTDEKVWTDMYNCVNATVKGATSVGGGFRFDGKLGSGAQWPVASQGQNQVYKFTEKEFTLVSNITIHDTTVSGDVSLIGASVDSEGNEMSIGLGYTQNNRWHIMQKSGKKFPTDVSLVPEKEYRVAITFANGAAFVYVDGADITGGKLTLSSTVSISHFFIGGMGSSSTASVGGSCTVKNVMLFNRALSQVEIAEFTKPKSNNQPNRQTQTGNNEDVSENLAANLATKSTVSTQNGKSLSPGETPKPSVIDRKDITNAKGSDDKMANPLNDIRNFAFQKDTEGDDSAVVSLYPVALICLLYSLIALA